MRIRMNPIPIEFVPTNEAFEDQNTPLIENGERMFAYTFLSKFY